MLTNCRGDSDLETDVVVIVIEGILSGASHKIFIAKV